MPAYLVTDGDLQPAPYREATPLGQLTVTATSQYVVSWGDGTTSGPYDQEGQPYPNGTISHTYDDVGSYTVTVIQQWSATWSLGGNHGELTGLQTEAVITGYPVRQLQAVITS